jgi:FkbM family methyltransferase
MKKNIRKLLSNFVPKGKIKEILKLWAYNFSASKNVKFGLNGQYFITKLEGRTFKTTSPLYKIVNDFDYYTNFYKPNGSDVIIDAGANQGFVSLYFESLLDSEGLVWAFEPDSKNISTFKHNIELNYEKKSKIRIVDFLLWDKNEMVKFHEAGSVGSSAHYMPHDDKIVMKRAITLDQWVKENNISKIDFIKMDIEGAELEAIAGAIETIKKFNPNFAIASYHIINGEHTYIKLEKIFKKIGYPYKTIHFNNKEIITFAGPRISEN